jgi:hypothetical protein
MAATIGFYLSGVIAIAIIFIGCRFCVGTFNGSGGLWRTGWRRTAFASVSIR